MKKTTYILTVALIALLASSCEDFLKANASKSISVDDLYSTREGYEDALAGVYLAAIDESLYGSYATFFVNDLAVVPYNYLTDTKILPVQRHLWSNLYTKTYTSAIWSAAYNMIANINMELRYLDSCEGILTQYEADLMKGELLGLRAYVHFDLMRLFGLNSWSGENASKMTVPYVTEFSKDLTLQKSYAETAEILHSDIDQAAALLEKDVVRSESNAPANFANSGNINGFWNDRRCRMNYYAVMALKADVLMWEKDLEGAASIAKSLADEMLGNGYVVWTDPDAYLNASGDTARNTTFTTEHIWSLVDRNLSERTSQYMWTTATATRAFVLDPDLVQNLLYPQVDPITGSNSGAEDIRGYANLLKYVANGFACHKFYADALTGEMIYKSPASNMPMLRLSQLYYIMAEEAAQNGRNAEALGYLDVVRAARGVTEKLSDRAVAKDEIEKECYREFIGEGKLIYFLKYRNASSSLGSKFEMNAEDLVYNYPDDEITFGRNQEK